MPMVRKEESNITCRLEQIHGAAYQTARLTGYLPAASMRNSPIPSLWSLCLDTFG